MNNSIYRFPLPTNEPILSYLAGSNERKALFAEIERLKGLQHEVPCIIGGKEYFTGNTTDILMPHDHQNPLGKYHNVGEKELDLAVEAAMKAHREWSEMPYTVRAAILNKVADLISGKYRALMSAATMLGQSKNIFQSEIDAVCETIDFLRFNAHFASKVYEFQPFSGPGMMNSMEYRALEGFVFTVSPFNFTAIASNLNNSPVLMGNVTIWKPASTAILSNYYLMKIFQEAGVPDGVINFIPGKGSMIGRRIMKDTNLAGVHFTGSNNTFNTLWKQVGENLSSYKSYPRLVGETGGKDFIFVHPSADAQEVAVAAVRGSFEYQGQKCSAASRMYVPKSLWPKVKDLMLAMLAEIKMGDVMDPQNFVNAVIDKPAFDTIMEYINYAKASTEATIVAGGNGDSSVGYFIEPTIIETTNPKFKTMEEEIFGPVLSVWVYADNQLEEAIHLCDTTSPYALTGAVFGRDRAAVEKLTKQLRYAAGNFYINDKPTGAVVGQQPFGGSRASGTNDKAGGELNLIRWASARTIKETFNTPVDYRYGYML
ncbi:MAG: L-glutamate gamma-semialdehyde dehydrogenase [Bacteroidales bacterium]|nr:L-glutamate gamma-semialdehyde dehydrogenase [Bacteroidales bacterium]